MKRKYYCLNCDCEFSQDINNMNEAKNVKCPKCHNKVDSKNHKKGESTFERHVGNVFIKLLDFYYYFYLIFSIISLILYYLGYYKFFIISFSIMSIMYIIELLLGFTRNLFGFLGIIVSGIIGFIIINNTLGILVGICYLFLASNIIKLIYNLVIKYLFRKYG